MDNLEVVVEELMKEQHKEMMRRLKAGDFDEKAFSFSAQLIENYEIPTLAPEADPVADLFSMTSPSGSASKGSVSLLFDLPQLSVKNDPAPSAKDSALPEAKSKINNLDETILSVFSSRDK
jgi:hypothetical protein